MKQVSLLGIPWDKKSSFLRGSAQAPDHIRRVMHNGASNYYSENGKSVGPDVVKDHGNIDVTSYDDLFIDLKSFILNRPEKFIFLGGDHSISFPIVKAMSNRFGKFHMLHIDAHSDLYNEFEGDRHSHACPMTRIMEEKLVSSMTQVGIRTLNDHQRQQAERYGVNIIEMKNWGGQKLSFAGPLYITLDMDVFDPGFAPGVSHHEPGGASPRQVIDLLQSIKVPLIGADIVEYNPTRDIHDLTASLACKMIKELASKMIP